jgi:hypothetical protein
MQEEHSWIVTDLSHDPLQADLDQKRENPKFEIRSTKQIQMTKAQNPKHNDLQDRTLAFEKKTMVCKKE